MSLLHYFRVCKDSCTPVSLPSINTTSLYLYLYSTPIYWALSVFVARGSSFERKKEKLGFHPLPLKRTWISPLLFRSLSLSVPPPSSSSFLCSYPSWPLSLLPCLLCGNITTSACMLFCGSQILPLLLCQEPGVVETLSLCTEGVDRFYIFESLC